MVGGAEVGAIVVGGAVVGGAVVGASVLFSLGDGVGATVGAGVVVFAEGWTVSNVGSSDSPTACCGFRKWLIFTESQFASVCSPSMIEIERRPKRRRSDRVDRMLCCRCDVFACAISCRCGCIVCIGCCYYWWEKQ